MPSFQANRFTAFAENIATLNVTVPSMYMVEGAYLLIMAGSETGTNLNLNLTISGGDMTLAGTSASAPDVGGGFGRGQIRFWYKRVTTAGMSGSYTVTSTGATTAHAMRVHAVVIYGASATPPVFLSNTDLVGNFGLNAPGGGNLGAGKRTWWFLLIHNGAVTLGLTSHTIVDILSDAYGNVLSPLANAFHSCGVVGPGSQYTGATTNPASQPGTQASLTFEDAPIMPYTAVLYPDDPALMSAWNYQLGTAAGSNTGMSAVLGISQARMDWAMAFGAAAQNYLGTTTGLSNTPTNFLTAAAVRLNIRTKAINWTNDTGTLSVRLFKADRVTPLTNSYTIRSLVGTGWADTPEVVTMTGVDTAATKADWDTAYWQLNWTWAVNMGNDTGNVLVDNLFFEIDYVALGVVQEGFRWRNDDGTETSATWLAAQDVNAPLAVDTAARLRVALATTGVTSLTTAENYDSGENWADLGLSPGNIIGFGQSFTGNGQLLSGVEWQINKGGAPTGTLNARLYAHTGTYGSTGIPTGSALATTPSINASTVPGGGAVWVRFDFDETFTLVNGTNYFVTINYTGTLSASDWLPVSTDSSTPTHPGNRATLVASTWTALSTQDMLFKLYTKPVAPAVLPSASPKPYALYYKKSTDSVWAPVPVGSGAAPVYIATSANISAGGQDTTAQLAAPAGLTTGDFTTGRMWDDENGADLVTVGPWSPLNLAGLVGWWDASDAATFSYSSGTSVSQWRDKAGGTAYNLDQATVGRQPERSGTQNGKATVIFTGTDVLRRSTVSSIGASFLTVFVVLKKTGANNTYEAYPFNVNPLGVNTPTPFAAYNTTADIGAGTYLNGNPDMRTRTSWVVYYFRMTSTNDYCEAGLNNIANNYGYPAGAWSTANQIIALGARGDDVTQFTGEVAEVVVTDSVWMTADEAAVLNSYLMAKWGVV